MGEIMWYIVAEITWYIYVRELTPLTNHANSIAESTQIQLQARKYHHKFGGIVSAEKFE